MKKQLFIFVLHVTLCSVSFAQLTFEEEFKIREIVTQWNTSHHLSTVHQLQNLYGTSILFYGKYHSKKFSINEKVSLLKRLAPFHQEIITPIEIIQYNSGTIKCQFTKRVKYKNKISDYPSYLLLNKEGQSYRITGESDLITDQNLNVELQLGKQLSAGDGLNLMWMLVVLLASLAIAVGKYLFKDLTRGRVVYRKKPQNKGKSLQVSKYSDYSTPRAYSNTSSLTSDTKEIRDAKRTGIEFVRYVCKKFESRTFSIRDCRGDVDLGGRFPESNRWPDLEIRLKSTNDVFAVECKFRKQFFQDTFDVRPDQLHHYRLFQTERKMKVYLILGVGGSSLNPTDIFIIPLEAIKLNFLTRTFVEKFRRRTDEPFVIDYETMRLS